MPTGLIDTGKTGADQRTEKTIRESVPFSVDPSKPGQDDTVQEHHHEDDTKTDKERKQFNAEKTFQGV